MQLVTQLPQSRASGATCSWVYNQGSSSRRNREKIGGGRRRKTVLRYREESPRTARGCSGGLRPQRELGEGRATCRRLSNREVHSHADAPSSHRDARSSGGDLNVRNTAPLPQPIIPALSSRSGSSILLDFEFCLFHRSKRSGMS